MPVPALFHSDLRDLLFADWAETVTFREVSQTFDPETGELLEVVSETLLPAVVGPRTCDPQRGTAHQFLVHERIFLLRMEDVPEQASYFTSRIRHGEDEYAVQTVDLAPLTNVLTLTTTLITPSLPQVG